jgi:Zn-dependent protease
VNSPLTLLFRDPTAFLAVVAALVVAITIHEFSHAAVATAQGDDTARSQGRLTLNPIKHLDPFGSIFMVLAGFGWGRPVPFSPAQLRNKRYGPVMVSLIGPISNFVLALVSALVLKALLQAETLNETAFTFVETFLRINLILGIFNLLPIPPLDGSRLLAALLPPSRQGIVRFLDQYGIYLLLGLVLLPVLNPSLNWLAPLFERAEVGLLKLVGII